jgi:hypothetical protein
MSKLTALDWVKHKQQIIDVTGQRAKLSRTYMDSIKQHDRTQKISYPMYCESFDYVDSLFPEVNIKSICFYTADRSFMESMGLAGMHGLCTTMDPVVVLCNDLLEEYKEKERVQISFDEVLVHELLHYAFFIKKPSMSRALDEEFAYGHSIGYMLNKGRTDEYIIQSMIPHFMSTINEHKIVANILVSMGIDYDTIRFKPPEEIEAIKQSFMRKFQEAGEKEATKNASLFLDMRRSKNTYNNTFTQNYENDFGFMEL